MSALADRFRSLHQEGTFVMPNPWDRGSARILEAAGFPALASSSAGFGRSIGKDDQLVTRDELVGHVEELTSVMTTPLNVDSERLFPLDPGGIAQTVRMLADAGASGCSIEDYDPTTSTIDPIERAAEAVAVAADSCAEHGLVLTARAEQLLYGSEDLDGAIERLLAYRDAGAEVLYTPGPTKPADIAQLVQEVDRPLNVLALASAPPIPELAELGVRRISLGSMLYNASYGLLQAAAEELRGPGTSNYSRPRSAER
ncbi:MAG: isocitrate lyase/PEP mutase family protein [Acidimicrobiales bacterium]